VPNTLGNEFRHVLYGYFIKFCTFSYNSYWYIYLCKYACVCTYVRMYMYPCACV